MRSLNILAAATALLGASVALAQPSDVDGEGGPYVSLDDAYEVGDVLPDSRDFAFLDPASYDALPDREGKLYAWSNGFAYLYDPATRTVVDVFQVERDLGTE